MEKDIRRWDMLNYLIRTNGYKNYLEIGILNGECFNNINCENKTSVDPMIEKGVATPTYEMTSDEFFNNIAGDLLKFDIVFIDGLHIADQVERDIHNSLKYLSDNGIVILHDCNPIFEIRQIVPRQQGAWNGDVWKAFVKYRIFGEWKSFALDADEGLGIIQKGVPADNIDPIHEWDTYKVFSENKKYLLGLESPDISNVERLLSKNSEIVS